MKPLQRNPNTPYLLHSLDPVSLIVSQNSNDPTPFQLTTESYTFERGPRYRAYAQLRESRLLSKRDVETQIQNELLYPEQSFEEPIPMKKQVKFNGNPMNSRKGLSSSSSVLAHSVPDFSSALRKENRKPPSMLSPVMELTPPSKSWGKGKNNSYGYLSNSGMRGSKSANPVEKKGGLMRKSYASIGDLKKISKAASNAINGGGGFSNLRSSVASKTTVLGTRRFY